MCRISSAIRAFSLRALALAALAAGAACAGSPSPPSPAPRGIGALDRCPAPLLRPAGSVATWRVRLANETADTVVVFLDRCFHHTRLADVPPGGARMVRLPDRLVAFPEGLRFHAYGARSQRHVGVFTAPVGEEPVLEVVVAAARAVPDSLLTPVAAGPAQGRVGAFAVAEGYAAVWARSTLGILTWACDARGLRHLTLSTGDKLAGKAARVQLRWKERGEEGAGAPEEAGEWVISTNVTDALLAPRGQVEPLTRRALTAEGVVVILTDEGGSRYLHEFDLGDLSRAMEGLQCFRPAGG